MAIARRESAFVSGGGGFLGSYVVEGLLDAGFQRIYVLARRSASRNVQERLQALWWRRPALLNELGKRIVPVEGDITCERLALDRERYRELAGEVSHIVHTAAEIGVNETAERFGAVNVDGTLNMLLFADEAQKSGGLARFVHVSTAYVAGTRNGYIREDELHAEGFNSLYEQSKYGAELLVRDFAESFPVSIVRPAQIVGDTKTGFVATFNTLYYPMKLYLKGQLPVIPVSAQQRLNMVPVDYVADLVVKTAIDPRAAGKTFHATLPATHQPQVGELIAFVREWARSELGYDPGYTPCLSIPYTAHHYGLGASCRTGSGDGGAVGECWHGSHRGDNRLGAVRHRRMGSRAAGHRLCIVATWPEGEGAARRLQRRAVCAPTCSSSFEVRVRSKPCGRWGLTVDWARIPLGISIARLRTSRLWPCCVQEAGMARRRCWA